MNFRKLENLILKTINKAGGEVFNEIIAPNYHSVEAAFDKERTNNFIIAIVESPKKEKRSE